MKNLLTILLVLILVFSCSKNDFIDTELNFEIDKETYRVNDTFELKIIISPIEKEKTIRMYKNLSNFDISFESTEKQLGFNQELKKRFIEGPPIFGDDSEYIDKFDITKETPFEKILYGTISELKDKIVFEIPELKISNGIDKFVLLKNSTIIIEGNCRTVYGGGGKSFIQKEIKILIE